MSDWKPKPGCIASITLGNGYTHPLAIWRLHDGWQTPINTIHPAHVDSARPVAVIDPEDREAVERFTKVFWSERQGVGLQSWTPPAEVEAMTAALREFANPKPPKPDEPQGRYAVVLDADGVEWLRDRNGSWCYVTQNAPGLTRWRMKRWSDIDAVRVLSEGVSDV